MKTDVDKFYWSDNYNEPRLPSVLDSKFIFKVIAYENHDLDSEDFPHTRNHDIFRTKIVSSRYVSEGDGLVSIKELNDLIRLNALNEENMKLAIINDSSNEIIVALVEVKSSSYEQELEQYKKECEIHKEYKDQIAKRQINYINSELARLTELKKEYENSNE